MNICKPLFITSLLWTACLVAIGQATGYDPLPKIIPPTPEAAAMQRFGETEIELFKGEPSINIPIYTLSTKNIAVPIMLNYNAGGFRVSELSTSVGLGWNLNAGGMISRSIRGQNDFKWPVRRTPDIRTFAPGSDSDQYKLAKDIIANNYDTEADLFSYSMLTRSGKFIFDDSVNNIYTIPHQKLLITKQTDSSGFIIRDENGVAYYFMTTETNHVSETCELGQPNRRNVSGTVASNWLLTKIMHPLGDSIVFEYESYEQRYRDGISEAKYQYNPDTYCAPYSGDFTSQQRKCTRTMWLNSKRIKKIIATGLGEVEFYYVTVRTDIDYYSENANAKSLDSIVVRNTGQRLNKFTFYYDYFLSAGLSGAATNDQPLYRRLKLLKINDESKGDYTFSYNTTPLPYRLSNAQDLLGFSTGGNTTGTMIPCGYGYSSCAVRTVNTLYLESAVLNAIKYPTGGKTKFFYEPHGGSSRKKIYDTVWQAAEVSADIEEFKRDTFYIGPSDKYRTLRVSWYLPQFSNRDDGRSSGSVKMPDGTILTLHTIAANGTLTLPRQTGNYIITVNNIVQHVDGGNIGMAWYDSVGNHWVTVNDYHSGLRIKQVLDSAGFGAGEIKRTFNYANPADSIIYFVDNRNAGSFAEPVTVRHCDAGESTVTFLCNYTRFSGESITPYGYEGDNKFGYKYVGVYYDTSRNGGRGYERYHFATLPEEMDSAGSYTGIEYFGKLLDKKTYRYNTQSNSYNVLKEEVNNYAFLVDEGDYYAGTNRFTARNEKFIASMKLQYLFQELTGCGFQFNLIPAEFIVETSLASAFSTMDNKKDITLYPLQGMQVKDTRLLFYENPAHDLLTRIKTTNSAGDTIITVFKYRGDYPAATGSDNMVTALNNFSSKHIISNTIEKVTYLKKPNGDLFVLGGTLTTFKKQFAIPDTVFSLELDTPLVSSQFQWSTINGSNLFTKDSRYKPQIIIGKLDAAGNTIEQKQVNQPFSAYIWDHQHTYPVAECVNADSANIAYTSFETANTGNWYYTGAPVADTSAPTGKMVYNLSNGSIIKNDIHDGPYIVSYWKKSGTATVSGSTATTGPTINGWTYFEHLVTDVTDGNTVISGTGIVDEVRLYPAGAQMNTFTYTPLVGITGKCDINNRITYYEYDQYGRLVLIKDEERNILKKITYKYQ
ncbi:MAG: hypothetical protein QM731_03305 [Chitinophagaceae bacterium]